jgi:hypothetical protein
MSSTARKQWKEDERQDYFRHKDQQEKDREEERRDQHERRLKEMGEMEEARREEQERVQRQQSDYSQSTSSSQESGDCSVAEQPKRTSETLCLMERNSLLHSERDLAIR